MDEITLTKHDLRWPVLFAEEAARIRAAVDGGLIVGIEHFGSTAVPGLSAKPIIDLLVAVRSLAEARERVIPVLEAVGYSYWRDDPAPDRLFLVKGLPPNGPRTHHVHIVGQGTSADRLLFRDVLRADPEEAKRYAALKQYLAARFPGDREAYTKGKTEYVYSVTQKARASEE